MLMPTAAGMNNVSEIYRSSGAASSLVAIRQRRPQSLPATVSRPAPRGARPLHAWGRLEGSWIHSSAGRAGWLGCRRQAQGAPSRSRRRAAPASSSSDSGERPSSSAVYDAALQDSNYSSLSTKSSGSTGSEDLRPHGGSLPTGKLHHGSSGGALDVDTSSSGAGCCCHSNGNPGPTLSTGPHAAPRGGPLELRHAPDAQHSGQQQQLAALAAKLDPGLASPQQPPEQQQQQQQAALVAVPQPPASRGVLYFIVSAWLLVALVWALLCRCKDDEACTMLLVFENATLGSRQLVSLLRLFFAIPQQLLLLAPLMNRLHGQSKPASAYDAVPALIHQPSTDAPCPLLLPSPLCHAAQGSVAAVMVAGVANRVLYKMAITPLKNYVFFMAQLQTFGYCAVYFSVLLARHRCVQGGPGPTSAAVGFFVWRVCGCFVSFLLRCCCRCRWRIGC
jgi:hypothetical protein